jgi:EAL domain-containing protein (putative c-di-GMP-specific phosphodiesterase class I)
MYRAKQTGRGRYVFFEERMNIEALDRVAIEQDLRRALARDEFVLHFQPQVDLRSGAVVGAEMLVRWAHPSRGLLAPDQFISIAENAGLIEGIGDHLLRKACAQYSRWRGEGLAFKRLAVNVSTRQLRQVNFWELVRAALTAADMAAANLELEITENLLLDDVPEVVANLARLESMGVRVAIDDFGTGYSSLAYLKRLPIHVVKIDRVFMRDAPATDDAATIVKTIVAMARSLRKEVVAEGVENNEQISFLLAIGCHEAQGFAISPPLPPPEFAAFLRTRHQSSRPDAVGIP